MSTKEQFITERQNEIEKWNVELENLEARIAEAGIDAKEKLEHEEHIKTLRQTRDEAKVKLEEIQDADDDTWEDFKDGLEHIWTRIKDGFEKVKAKF